jgi:two-component system, OmpR family, KDP operon response regulator KdpE
MNALIIDDEVQIRRLLRMALESKAYTVHEAEAGQTGLQEAVFRRPDVILLDLGLPDMDGVTVLKRLREWSDVPVLILSVRDQEAVKVAAFDAGADDYVTKPFSTAELIARLSAIQRRRFTQRTPVHECGALRLDIAHHEAKLAGEALKLTPTEFTLLKVLVHHAGRIVTQRQIIREVWATGNSSQSENLRVVINHLRKKIGPNGPAIINEPGIGYRLTESSASSTNQADPAIR